MLKILIHKNMQEFAVAYFRDRKTGGKKIGGALVGMIVLYAFLFLLLAGSFAAMASLFFMSAKNGDEWIAFSIMGLLAIVMAALINGLTSYSQLYLAKDNEFLLAMPINPGTILTSRMVSTYIMGLVYVFMVWIPTIVVGIVMHKMSVLAVVMSVITMLVAGIVVLALTCLIGWLVAFLVTKFKNQKVLSAVLSVVFIGAIYVFQFKSNKLFTAIADNMSGVGTIIKSKLFPFYLMGQSSVGNALGFVGFVLIAAILMALAYLLISKTFIKVAMTKAAGKQTKFKEKQIKTSSVDKALLTKERARFFGGITYMINTGLGVIVMVALSVLVLVKGGAFVTKFAPLLDAMPEIKEIIPLAVVLVIIMLEAMTESTPFGISIEGKNLWILQTMPVDYYKVLRQKVNFNIWLQGFPALILAVAIQQAFNFNIPVYAGIVAVTVAYSCFSSTFGLVMNLKHPRLDWTTEAQVVKQGLPLVLNMFGGWGVALIIAAGGYLLRNIIGAGIFLIAIAVILFVGYILLDKWLKTKGTQILRYL